MNLLSKTLTRLHRTLAMSPGVSLKDLPKSAAFTSRLPPDAAFPTPAASAAAPASKLGPRLVREALYTYVRPTSCTKTPELLAVSPAAFQSLGLSLSEAENPEFVHLVAGNGTYEDGADENGIYPWAQCYGGWQFGQWAGQLGDGRAISLFEGTNPETGERYEVQLKGAGQTPYSRFADGRAVLRSSIREFVVSEYLNSIGIPSTRALALTLLPGEQVARERMEPCAIVTRMAQSWIRIGTFDLFRFRGDRVRLRVLSDYVRDEVLRMPKQEGVDEQGRNRYENMYREIVRRNAKTVAMWQVYGFMNGVLNTDNTSVLGLSLDFGPFAFMDAFDPSYTPNHDDHMLRYSFRNQPTIIWWNLTRLGEDLAELLAVPDIDDPVFIAEGVKEAAVDELVSRAEAILEDIGNEYKTVFLTEYKTLMAQRMGFKTCKETDMDTMFSPCLDLMQKFELDFHHVFRRLAEVPVRGIDSASEEDNSQLAKSFHYNSIADQDGADQAILEFLRSYAARLAEEGVEDSDRIPAQKKLNPKFVPKNWVLDEIIQRVEKKGDRQVLKDVMKLVMRPFDDTWEGVDDAQRWCGEVPDDSRSTQCSCSS
ncbi:hypothetical protein BZA05DRAFT_395485 [Tricharina praecox]|uniref:uncharacterized protein n=1 Tax=Tricharina praecox TaxID=43433 RepID=UPI00221FB42B|nr:uncharacterized protein BZA05DRAFT_395485 [Tricharina praecox]KAI5854042.1 hypothetical protein BZA05DRAFT_395485 [Tricharina praecox]